MYVRSDINYNESIFEKNNCSSSNIEIQWVEVNIKNMRKILIINTYRPPSGDYKLFSKYIFDSFSNSIIKDNTDIFIMGDIFIFIFFIVAQFRFTGLPLSQVFSHTSKYNKK